VRDTLQFARVFALGTWVASIFYFSAAVAPGAFRVLSSQDQAGLLVEFTLGRLHLLGVAAAVMFLLASLLLGISGKASAKALLLPSFGVLIMLALTLISQDVVIRRMADLRRQMGSVVTTPADNPSRVEFDRLHGVSVDLEGAVLLVGFVSLFFTMRDPSTNY
jgi:ABC-type nickel/cobalt efflux system permease component RcnA